MALRFNPSIVLDQRLALSWEPEKLQVVSFFAALGETLAQGIKLFAVLVGAQIKRRHDGHRDLSKHAEDTQSQPSEAVELAVDALSVRMAVPDDTIRGDDLESLHGACEAGEPKPGAVCASRDSAGQRLRIDIALVGKCPTERAQNTWSIAQTSAGTQRGSLVGGVEFDQARAAVELNAVPIGGGHGSKRMTGP